MAKRLCVCCKKRVATLEDADNASAMTYAPSSKIFDVCRKCYDKAQNSGLIKSVFYTVAKEEKFV